MFNPTMPPKTVFEIKQCSKLRVHKTSQEILLNESEGNSIVSNSFINVSMYLVFTTNWGQNRKVKIIYK